MKLRLLALVAGLLLVTGAAPAQIGIYATPIFTHASNSTSDQGVFTFLGANSTSRLFSGVGIGVYDEFAHGTKVDAGVDVRGSIQKGGNAHLNQFLVGGRVSFHPVAIPVKPYLEVLAGVGGTRAATNPIYQNKVEYGAVGGLDYRLGKLVDFRVIEIGYNSLQTINTQAVTGASSKFPSSQLLSFSTGIVIRLPVKIPIPKAGIVRRELRRCTPVPAMQVRRSAPRCGGLRP